MIIVILLILGLCFGSFVNALVWRVHQQSLPQKQQKVSPRDLSLSKGRSMCVDCKHTLGAADLLPVISWLALKGKCRYCRNSISWQYPFVEVTTALLFIISYTAWPRTLVGWETVALGLWLASLVGLVALVVYDIRWMLLPNRIVFPLYVLAALFTLVRVLSVDSLDPFFSATVGIMIGGGIFYILFQISEGRWIGGGDVKLGFLLGALVGGPVNSFMLLFIASLLGTVFALPLMISRKLARSNRIAFGPFLILAAFIVMLFGSRLSDLYLSVVGLS